MLERNKDITDVFENIANGVYKESKKSQQPQSMNGLSDDQPVYLNEDKSCANEVKSCTYRSENQTFYLFIHQVRTAELQFSAKTPTE